MVRGTANAVNVMVKRAVSFDKMLLEQALQAKTPSAVGMLIRMAERVEADHMVEVLEQHEQRLLEAQEPRPFLPAGCVQTSHGIVIQCRGRLATMARRQLVDFGYQWRWAHPAGRNIKVWNLLDYEAPRIDLTPIQWSSCSSGGNC